jgi:hypothetical protein
MAGEQMEGFSFVAAGFAIVGTPNLNPNTDALTGEGKGGGFPVVMPDAALI